MEFIFVQWKNVTNASEWKLLLQSQKSFFRCGKSSNHDFNDSQSKLTRKKFSLGFLSNPSLHLSLDGILLLSLIKLLSLFFQKVFQFFFLLVLIIQKALTIMTAIISLLFFTSGDLHVRYDDDKKRGRSFKEFFSLHSLIIFHTFVDLNFFFTMNFFLFRAGTFIQLPLALIISLLCDCKRLLYALKNQSVLGKFFIIFFFVCMAREFDGFDFKVSKAFYMEAPTLSK